MVADRLVGEVVGVGIVMLLGMIADAPTTDTIFWVVVHTVVRSLSLLGRDWAHMGLTKDGYRMFGRVVCVDLGA